jgi:hypothetical protein
MDDDDEKSAHYADVVIAWCGVVGCAVLLAAWIVGK